MSTQLTEWESAGWKRDLQTSRKCSTFHWWLLFPCVLEVEGAGNMWQTNKCANVMRDLPFRLELHWVRLLVRQWQWRISSSDYALLFICGVKSQVAHCLLGLWTLNNVHIPLEKRRVRARNVCDALGGPRCQSPNNKVRYKKGGFEAAARSSYPDKSLECAVSMAAYGGVSAPCLPLADLLWDGAEYLPGRQRRV